MSNFLRDYIIKENEITVVLTLKGTCILCLHSLQRLERTRQ